MRSLTPAADVPLAKHLLPRPPPPPPAPPVLRPSLRCAPLRALRRSRCMHPPGYGVPLLSALTAPRAPSPSAQGTATITESQRPTLTRTDTRQGARAGGQHAASLIPAPPGGAARKGAQGGAGSTRRLSEARARRDDRGGADLRSRSREARGRVTANLYTSKV